ncbi:MAG: glycerol acyltransferase [Flavobacteriales bacterium CG_4_10_14_0_2_um_filter_32_8]|nr:MAG: glycerol acyltransferase [Flavobacteriales bacterium CG_4_10_14_0_2_um_filter_32_8]PJB13777.1 MAG: glycerol acyltransferase [Flavobacteriales bacterium CG_4_9_14_3_um_filter_32_8]
MQEKLIDIEKVIKSKNPKLLRWLPQFLINYLKRTLHQDEVNQVLYENRDLYGYDFCQELIHRFQIEIKVKGLENIPKEGGYIFASNHPLGGMDAMALVTVMAPIRTDIKFIVNDILLNLKNLKGLFVGVNKHGVNSKESLNLVDDLFASDQAIFVFPAGLVSRRKKGIVADLEWKKTFITRAKKHHKSIIPVYVGGNLSNFFYHLSNFRTNLGIKANLEMLYLADETFKQKNKTLTIIFGKPIPASFFNHSKSDKEWAKWMETKVHNMKNDE